MLKSLVRWGLFSLALVVAGPAAWMAVNLARGADGGPATALFAASPAIGLLMALVAILLATIVGATTARLVDLGSGFLDAGIVLAWAAAATPTVDALARSSQTATLGWKLSIEGVILAALGAGAAWVICRAGTHSAPPVPAAHAESSKFVGLITIAIAAAGALAGAWLVAQNMLKGQAIAAAALGAVFAGTLSMLMNHRALPWQILVGVFAAAALGPLAGCLIHGSTPNQGFLAAASGGVKLTRFAALVPMDWLAGGFIGIPMGISLGSWLADGRRAPTAHSPESGGSSGARPASAVG